MARRRVAWVAFLSLTASCAAPDAAPTALMRPAPIPTKTAPAVPTAPTTIVATGDPTVAVGEHFYHPAQLRVDVGATVTWRNFGALAHDVKVRDGTIYSNPFGPGASFSYTFTRAGRYPYDCTLHAGMFGEVEVR